MALQNSDFSAAFADVADAKADDERNLMHRLANGDRAAFWDLWKYYEPLLARRCLQWMGGNHADAKDALSDASLRAWQYVSSHATEITNIKAWLLRLLYNHCMNMRRSHQTYLRYTQPMQDIHRVTAVSSTSDDASFEETLLRCETQMYMRSRINALPPRLREPVILYFFQEMCQSDIAASLHISPENVRKRLQHARALLRQQLVPYLQGEPGSLWEKAKADIPPAALLVSMQNEGADEQQTQETIPSQVAAIRAIRIAFPDRSERLVYLALSHKPTRQLQKLETLQTYVRRHPTGWRRRIQLARLLYSMGHWEEAIAAYRQVLQRQPRDLEAQLSLGHMLYLLRKEDEATALYKNALALTNKPATRYHLEGHIAACHHHLEETVQLYTAAAAAEPCNAAHWQALGLTRLQAGQSVEAAQAFETVLGVNPDDLVALTYSYSPLVATGRVEEALKRVERALEIDPKNPLALVQLAHGRYHRGRLKDGIGRRPRALFDRASQARRDCPVVYLVE
jgi:RNA polymerase sigma factor (sigma-70 family)